MDQGDVIAFVGVILAAVVAAATGLVGVRYGSTRASTQAATDKRWGNARWAAEMAADEESATRSLLGVRHLRAMRDEYNDDPKLRAFIRTSLQAVVESPTAAYARQPGPVVGTPLPPQIPPVGGTTT